MNESPILKGSSITSRNNSTYAPRAYGEVPQSTNSMIGALPNFATHITASKLPTTTRSLNLRDNCTHTHNLGDFKHNLSIGQSPIRAVHRGSAIHEDSSQYLNSPARDKVNSLTKSNSYIGLPKKMPTLSSINGLSRMSGGKEDALVSSAEKRNSGQTTSTPTHLGSDQSKQWGDAQNRLFVSNDSRIQLEDIRKQLSEQRESEIDELTRVST